MRERMNRSILIVLTAVIFITTLGVIVHEKNLIKNSINDVVVITKIPNIEHLTCLATNIYHEAANEPFLGQIAVARVVMNRITHGFASNPCKVIYQSATVNSIDSEESKKQCQFSWVCEGKSKPHDSNPKYILAKEIAHKVLTEDAWSDIIPSNVLFFHNTSVKPNWHYSQVLTIGNHIFYSKNKKSQK